MALVEYYFNKKLEFNLIAETYRKAYKRELNLDYWRWRFLNNSFSDKVLISYIIEKDILAAYYSASPCIIIINNTEYKFVLVSMAMTHPDFQGKGYLKMVAGELFNVLKRDGYIGVIGFANANSHYGHRKYLNWVDLSVLNTFKTDKQEIIKNQFQNNNKFKFISSEIDIDSINLITHLKCCEKSIHVKRDSLILKWRLLDNPRYQYYTLKVFSNNLLVGLIFYKIYDGNTDIMEYFYNPLKKFDRNEVLTSGINNLLIRSKDSVNIWSNIHSDEHLMLEKIGFRETNFITYMGVIPFKKYNELTDLKNWHFRFIDSDVF